MHIHKLKERQKHYQKIRRKFDKYIRQIYFGPLVTELTYGLPSKHLFKELVINS